MQEDLLAATHQSGKVYSTRTIMISCFFGGVFASSFMLYRNFKTLGKSNKAYITILLTILFLLFLIFSIVIPALDRIPPILYNLFFTVVVAFAAHKYQGKLISSFISDGGIYYSTGRAVVICILSFLATMAFGFTVYFA